MVNWSIMYVAGWLPSVIMICNLLTNFTIGGGMWGMTWDHLEFNYLSSRPFGIYRTHFVTDEFRVVPSEPLCALWNK